MLTCQPTSICSWNFTVLGSERGPATVRFNFLSEQGEIVRQNVSYMITKGGFLSGHWDMVGTDGLQATADKPNPFFRQFTLAAQGSVISLRAQTPFTRSFDILGADDTPLGVIAPVHAFTRRATIDCNPQVPEPLQLFAFWLVALLWKRAATDNNNNTAAASS